MQNLCYVCGSHINKTIFKYTKPAFFLTSSDLKLTKKKQDTKIDLPTIGFNTLKECKAAGIKGIVLKHKKNIFLDKKKSINFANKNKMFIFVK